MISPSPPVTDKTAIVIGTAAGERSVKFLTPDERQAEGRELRRRLSAKLLSLGLQDVFCLDLAEHAAGYWTLRLERWDGQPMSATVAGELLTPETLKYIRTRP